MPGPNLGVLSAFIGRVASAVAAQPKDPSDSSMLSAPLPAGTTGFNTEDLEAHARARPLPQFQDRREVIRTLNSICAYYKKHEPSSPLPLLLERCQRLATLNFIEIVKELSPDALPNLELITGSRGK